MSLSEHIQPICLHSGSDYFDDAFYHHKKPNIAGWGYTSVEGEYYVICYVLLFLKPFKLFEDRLSWPALRTTSPIFRDFSRSRTPTLYHLVRPHRSGREPICLSNHRVTLGFCEHHGGNSECTYSTCDCIRISDRILSSFLLEAEIPIVDVDVCQGNYANYSTVKIDQTMLCAGKGGKDACQVRNVYDSLSSYLESTDQRQGLKA